MSYEQDALRTLSTGPEVIERAKANIHLLRPALLSMIALAASLDAVKKIIFYGKKIDGPQFANEGHPHSDALAASRIDQRAIDLLHAGLGIASESGEYLLALFNHLFDRQLLDVPNLIEEHGDIEWYQAIGLSALGSTIGDAQRINIEKLKARYAEKFTEHESEDRDIDNERDIIERGAGYPGGAPFGDHVGA